MTIALVFSVMTSAQASNDPADTIQKPVTKKRESSLRKQLNALTKRQINQLKDGALLVRLQTRKNSITALRKTGKDKLADEMERTQRNYNVKVVSAFRKNFNFCPTYFFFSDYSQNIREGKFDKVVFLSDSLLADTTIKFNASNFLTAEFGTIEQDTAKYFSHTSYEPDQNWSLKSNANYCAGPDMGFEALIVKSDQLVQLRRPFPYYVRTYGSRSLNKTIKKLNIKLHRFYNVRNK